MMPNKRRTVIMSVGMCADLAICGVGLVLTNPSVDRVTWNSDTFLVRHPLRTLILCLVLALYWHIALVVSGAYKSYRTVRLREHLWNIGRGTSLVSLSVVVWGGGLDASISAVSLLRHVALFWAITFVSFIAMRLSARLFLKLLRRRGRNLRHVLIVGSNRRAVALANDLVTNTDFGYRLAGFVDDSWHFDGAPEPYKALLLGGSEDIRQILSNIVVDEVIIALPIASSYDLTRRIIDWCHQQGLVVRWDASLYDMAKGSAIGVEDAARLVTLHDSTREYWRALTKRLLDLAVATMALGLLFPVLAIVALCIKLTSPGPVFFLQERLGLGKRRFKVFKFRTMVTNAEALMGQVEHLNQSNGPTFKLMSDPRITPIGIYLRKTSIDELPQLLNVWLGHMSLVGPRPLPLRDYRGFSEDWHRRRFSVKPGITCLWQVNGRSSVGFERWMELDMDYIDQWSLSLDLKILLKTIPAVVRGTGAA